MYLARIDSDRFQLNDTPMAIRVLAVTGLIIGAALLTVWRLHGLNPVFYGIALALIVVVILYLVWAISRLTDPRAGRIRRYRK